MAATIKSVGGNDPALIWGAAAYNRVPRPFLLVNLDLANIVYYDDNPGITTLSPQIPPLGHATFDGAADVFASTLNPALSALVQIMPGVTSWGAGLRAGSAPFVLGLQSVVIQDQTASNLSFFSFPAASRIWGARLGFAAGANGSYSSGTITHVYCKIGSAGSVFVNLAIAELALAAPATATAVTDDAQIPGLAVQPGDHLQLDLNANSIPANTVLAASAIVLYSSP